MRLEGYDVLWVFFTKTTMWGVEKFQGSFEQSHPPKNSVLNLDLDNIL